MDKFLIRSEKCHELLILKKIASDDCVTQKALGKYSGMSEASANDYVHRLEKLGLISLTHISRKKIIYKLTEDGITRLEYLDMKFEDEIIEDIFDKLPISLRIRIEKLMSGNLLMPTRLSSQTSTTSV